VEYLSRLLVSVKPVDPARHPSIAQPPELMPHDPLAWLPLLRHCTHGLGEGSEAISRMGDLAALPELNLAALLPGGPGWTDVVNRQRVGFTAMETWRVRPEHGAGLRSRPEGTGACRVGWGRCRLRLSELVRVSCTAAQLRPLVV